MTPAGVGQPIPRRVAARRQGDLAAVAAAQGLVLVGEVGYSQGDFMYWSLAEPAPKVSDLT